MKFIQSAFRNVATVLFAGIVVAFFSGQAEAQQFKRITTEEDYISAIAGKRLVAENGDWVRISKNGQMEGEFGGKKLTGIWKWSSGYWCRNGRLGGNEIGSDCQVVEIGGNMSRATTNQGKGRTSVYRIE